LIFLALENIPVLESLYSFLDKLLIDHHLLWVLMLLTSMITLYSGILYLFENKHVFTKKN
jgi:hypothetical protein